jgi:SAM-dependent methyltransferase
VARRSAHRRAFSGLGGPVETAGDPTEAQALACLWRVDPGLERALTHGFHSYAGRLHPSIARGALSRWSRPGDAVVDPFCGGGPVLVEAMALGRAALGTDASPLAVAIARVRTTPLGEAGRRRLFETARRIALECAERARKRRRPESPAWARREFERFHPHVALELLGLREQVMGLDEDEVGQALRMCLSSILVKLMRSGPEAPRDGREKRIGRGLPSRLLADRAALLARGLAALERRVPSGTPAPRIWAGDARDLAAVAGGSAALVVSSPPYAGTYDYEAQHDVRFTWLELPRGTLRATQLGVREAAGPAGVEARAWREGRRRWLGEMARVVRPGGHALLVVGDGVVEHQPEDAAGALVEAAPPAAFASIARASQPRPILDPRLRALFAARPRREHLVLLRRLP